MTTITRVTFRKELGGILAIFYKNNAGFNGYRHDNIECYSHVGQHSACAPEYYKRLAKATPAEYGDLKAELESIGYILKVS